MAYDLTTPPCIISRRIIPRDRITVKSDISRGEFGIVRHAVYTCDSGQKVDVVAKSISQARLERGMKGFLKEASSMQSVSHSNLLTLYGLVFQEDQEIMLITEYAPMRSLTEYLLNESNKRMATLSKLCLFATQIATGMTYLEAQGLIHRDLATRNILVFSANQVKIGDFGLSRALGLGKGYYHSKRTADKTHPIAWCAPECMNMLRFSTASDVWSFGVTLWEMFSYGKKPWDGVSFAGICDAVNIPKSQRLDRPMMCPIEYYNLMLTCWAHDPDERPQFSKILRQMKSMKPTTMKALSDSIEPGDHILKVKEKDIITVINKKPKGSPSWKFWFGVLEDGRSGLFDATECLPVSGNASPPTHPKSKTLPAKKAGKKSSLQSSPQQSPTSQRKALTEPTKKSGLNYSRSFLSPNFRRKATINKSKISNPQSDFKHKGHIGNDGASFGDLSFLGTEPVKEVVPLRAARSVEDLGIKNEPVVEKENNDTQEQIKRSATTETSTQNGHPPEDYKVTTQRQSLASELLSNFEFPDLSLTDSLGSLNLSTFDDLMKGLAGMSSSSSKCTASNERSSKRILSHSFDSDDLEPV